MRIHKVEPAAVAPETRTIGDAVLTPSVFDQKTKSYTGAVFFADGSKAAGSRLTDAHWASADEAPNVRTLAEDKGVYLGHFFNHFGHFLIETLPQLYWAKIFEGPLHFHEWKDANYKGNNPTHTAHALFSLKALNIPNERIALVGEGRRVRHLLIPPQANSIEGKPDLRCLGVYRKVAALAEIETNDTGARRIYLSRRMFNADRIINETEIEKHMVLNGFQVYFPERLPFAEQVALVSRADIVCGLNGSALHLACFMRPGSQLMALGGRGMKAQKPINNALDIRTDIYHGVKGYTTGATADISDLRKWTNAILG